MLQIKNIKKHYVTGGLEQKALDDVSLNLRDNEFVAILGPSGSGKTTLLNIIGGLDRYDSGDLIINGISTKKYKDRDWDSYRNHTIGFVFQSYNLIPHQTVLSNVELALTISGISKSERRRRAKEALVKVGLGDQIHKKPNQMSGGQMQRVAIARALVNDPDILLADEPTGALDTETSIQVMELLKEVAKERLVVMVTHNPELAESYATRIVKLRDGKIKADSAPYEIDMEATEPPKHKNMGKSSMSVLTALSLSFNNLRTKKGRTFLIAFAGSIGIIGIALIQSLSTGVNNYISDIQKDTMTSYPISIEEQAIDLSSMMNFGNDEDGDVDHDLNAVYSNTADLEMVSSMTSSITKNNLTAFKKYLEDPDCELQKYVGQNGIAYSYDVKFDVMTYDKEGTLVNADGSTLRSTENNNDSLSATMSNNMTQHMSEGSNFDEILPGTGDKLVSAAVTDNYDMVYGEWPDSYDEVVLVLDKNNEITSTTLYELGILPSSQYKEIMKKISNGEEVKLDTSSISYEDICNQKLYMIPGCDKYKKNANGYFDDISKDNAELEALMQKGVTLKITGIIRPKDDAETLSLTSAIGYTKALTDYLIDYTDRSEVVKAQKADPKINVLNGMHFSTNDQATIIADTKSYLANLGVSEKAKMCKEMMQASYGSQASGMMNKSEQELADALDAYLADPKDEVLMSIYKEYISTGSYDDNLDKFGVVSLDAPSAINIYADSFEDKDSISDCIDDYNSTASEADQITYTDYIGLLMSSVTTIVNVISYVLIAFVSVSLVVSSIMIGIITYISVLERTKEIGILRSIGASKHNISQVFNAETFIIGLLSGLIGIGITLILILPINAIIHSIIDSNDVNAMLPISNAVILIVLSTILTLIGGLIPAKKAAKKDPVKALRTE